MSAQKKRALISVSDKRGIEEFAKALINYGYEVISTGGTYERLKIHGAISITEVTNFPEALDGRVKTLHPAIYGGILAVRENPTHMETLESLNISTIDMVVVNLYPFKATIQNPNATESEIIENIDIGGPTMLRSAAKNHAYVTVISDPSDYPKILEEIASGEIALKTRKNLAAKAFRHTAAYDALIAAHFTTEPYPESLTLTYEKQTSLRYGENPHQQAALYSNPLPTNAVISAKQLHGKELSYNNIGDADVAVELAREFDTPAAVAVKHQNPCGVGIGETITEAYTRAYEADPVSIFGGIVALNREVDEPCARQLSEIFLEIIIAPSFTKEALEILTRKKNLRLLQLDMKKPLAKTSKHLYHINGGLLIQDKDRANFEDAKLTFPTIQKPTAQQLETAKFAWRVVKYVKSNGILIARNNQTVGIGPGQTNRVGAAKIALSDAGKRAKGAILASDAFFPMPDTVEEAAKAGIKVIIQTGGSVKDQDSIEACNRHNIAMIFTGIRHFKH